jgi:L-lactate dehydrogenase complex protein LldG
MSARDDILGRVRSALADRPAPDPVPWEYGAPNPSLDGTDLVDLFVERVEDYRARVTRVPAADVEQAVAAALAEAGATTAVADDVVRSSWPGAAAEWRSDEALSAVELDRVDAVVTTATVAIANTGTLVLDHGPGQGRRATSLVPDVHVCVVTADQVVGDVPEAVARLVSTGTHLRPLTWISGPSATSDIELDRVEGVHGPRTLHVVVAEG